MPKLIMMRHGESEWNKRNLFTGWVDVPLSTKGIDEALKCGELIKDFPIDKIFTSTLIRAISTATLIMTLHHSGKVPVVEHSGEQKQEEWAQIYSVKAKENIIPMIRAWELNERMYGELQGLNKAETVEKYGAEQVKIWRRSYDIPPPNGESLAMTAARTLPYFKNQIVPCLKNGMHVMVSAHGNSLRSIIMELDGLSHEEVVNLEIATGMPIIYESNGISFARELLR